MEPVALLEHLDSAGGGAEAKSSSKGKAAFAKEVHSGLRPKLDNQELPCVL